MSTSDPLKDFVARGQRAQRAADKIIAAANARPKTNANGSRPVLACRFCGCTEITACLTDLGPCHWILTPHRAKRGHAAQPGVCSNPKCVLAFEREKRRERRAAGPDLTALANLKPHAAYRDARQRARRLGNR